MTKAELIDNVYRAMGGTFGNLTKRDVKDVVQLTFTHIGNAITREHRFCMPQFGTFSQRYRKMRRGVNPQNGMMITIPATRTVGFKPAPNLKQDINKRRRLHLSDNQVQRTR